MTPKSTSRHSGQRGASEIEPQAIALQEVTVRLGSRLLLDALSLSVASGESVAISGRSGTGKTTMLSCALGLQKPSAGSVALAGQQLAGLSRRRRAILRAESVGVIFQHGELVPELTAEENVALPLMLGRKDRSTAIEHARRALDDVEVLGRTLARDLSGGETQRVALARALIGNPSVVIADEPTGSLDADLRDQAAAQLFDITSARGVALLIVTHDPAVARSADRRYILRNGSLQPAQ